MARNRYTLGLGNTPVDNVGYLIRFELGLKLVVGDLLTFKEGAVSHSFSLVCIGSTSELEDGGLVLSLLMVRW